MATAMRQAQSQYFWYIACCATTNKKSTIPTLAIIAQLQIDYQQPSTLRIQNSIYEIQDLQNYIQIFFKTMGKKSIEQVVKEHQQLGFERTIIEIAYANVGGDSDKIIEEIFRLQAQSQSYPTKPSNPQDEDAQLSKAIELSMNQAKDKKISLEPLNPEQRLRKTGVPVGLKNIGNTCYFNSLLQTYFQNIAFVKEILSYQTPPKYRNIKDQEVPKLSQQDFDFKRKLLSCRLVQNLKALFCSLIASDRKYLDPTAVLSTIVDDYGNELAIGDQKDIGQFNLIFLSRIEDGLQEWRKEKQMDIERQGKEKPFLQSPSKINVFGKEESEGSLLRRSSIRLSNNSIIAEQFIGKIQHTFINQKQSVKIILLQINKTEEELFSLLFVNVKNKQLYKACEQITISHIDDYRNEKGQVIGVEKQSWIKEAPKTLFFQIDRVIYDKVTLTPQKINDLFDFPTTFFIDPFLHKNKQAALKVQKAVRELRQKKQKYLNAVQSIQKYGNKKLNLVDLLGQTFGYLQSQANQMDMENQLDNPTNIRQLTAQINPSVLQILSKYQQSLENRLKDYRNKISQIEKEIEKIYSQINQTPYYLYSLLIHEGGADSGHYYSYIYEHKNNKWRKYNDINITEESQEQVLRQGKGINSTSAYYLVYAQKQVLAPKDQKMEKLKYYLSNEDGYMGDLYSCFLSQDQKKAINNDNHQLYYTIQQHKMNSFATRVIDVYAKKFETFNQIFRKNKPEKKKNTPPVLVSLPIYVKSLDDEEYKSLLIEQAINQYGPKEVSPVFEEQLKKKLGNFNDFKKPKKFSCNLRLTQEFMKNYSCAIAARRLFQSIEKEQYHLVLVIIRELLFSDQHDYFNWLARLLTKIFVVRFLVQAEHQVNKNPSVCLQRLKYVFVLLAKYTNLQEQKMLHTNVHYWINQIMIEATGPHKEQIQQILNLVNSGKYNKQFTQLEQQGQKQYQDLVNGIDLNDAMWNSSRQENTVVNQMLDARERVKGKIEGCNKLYTEMKKFVYALKKEERDRFVKA